MSAILTSLFAVTLLLNPPEERPVSPSSNRTVGVSQHSSDRFATASLVHMTGAGKSPTSARVTSRTSDFDGKEGVVMFEGDVCVRYSDEFAMCADRLYMFLAGTNEVSRVVAVGAVSITNEDRVGTCAMATYRRQKGEIEMFGDGKENFACLSERGGGAATLEGTRIRFWLDSEQAEVENSRITARGLEGAKRL